MWRLALTRFFSIFIFFSRCNAIFLRIFKLSAAFWTLPPLVDRKISMKYNRGGEKMKKKDQERRVYPKEFKAEAAALAEKREKPIGRIAADLGLNESVLRRRMQQAREAAGGNLPAFPGYGRPRDEEPARLRKENKALKEAV
jgi:transposase